MATTRLLSAMVATWNNVATTFTGLKLNVTDTASASGSLLMDLQVGGASNFSVARSGEVVSVTDFWVKSNGASAGIYLGTSADIFLTRDAANTTALRRTSNAQTFRVYNTYTDASNYERGVFDWAGTANTLRIGTEAAGTGTVRNIQLVAGSNSVTMTPGASNLLTLNGGLTTVGTITSGGNINANGGSLISSGSVYTAVNTVATLPTAVGQTGARRFVTDSTATMAAGVGTAVVGGGSNKVPVYSDGTNWLIG